MDEDCSSKLVVVEVRWEQKMGYGRLFREVIGLLLRDPDLTDRDMASTMELQAIPDEEGGEP